MEERSEHAGINWLGWGVLIVLIGGGVLIYANNSMKDECKNRATAAAVDRYPINEYPDTAMRGQLQEEYKLNYIRGACN